MNIMTTTGRRGIVLAVLAAIVLALAGPEVAMAATFRSGDSITVAEGQRIDGDLYAAGNTVTIRGQVDGDVYAAGNDVVIAGDVSGTVWAAGSTVRIEGTVGGSVHAAGSTVRVAARTGRDLMVGASEMVVEDRSSIGHDALFGANRATLDGTVGRGVQGGGANVRLGAKVADDVQLDVDRLTLTEGAEVGGDLVYRSARDADIASGATVSGRTERQAPRTRQAQPSPAAAFLFAVIGWLRSLVGLALFGLLLALLAPAFITRSAERIREAPLPSLGLGLAVLFVTPPLAMLVFVIGLLIGGWWIGVFMLMLYVIAMVVAYEIAALFLGRLILRRLHRDGSPVWAILLGVLILSLITAIPFIGWLISFAAVLFGLGAMAGALFARRAATPDRAGPMQPPAPAYPPPPAP